MAITKRTETGQRTVLPDGVIWVRTDTVLEEDGVEISRTFHRHVLAPGDDFSVEADDVRRLAETEHTPGRVAAYKVAQAARRALAP